MIAVVPEKSLMGNDQVGTQLMGFSDNFGGGIDRRYDAGAFPVCLAIEDLVSGLCIFDPDSHPGTSAVILDVLYDFAYQHVPSPFLIPERIVSDRVVFLVFLILVGFADLDQIQNVVIDVIEKADHSVVIGMDVEVQRVVAIFLADRFRTVKQHLADALAAVFRPDIDGFEPDDVIFNTADAIADIAAVVGDGEDRIALVQIIAQFFDRIVDNSKVLAVTGMKQSDMMPLYDGLKREIERTPKDYPWRNNQRMDDYLAAMK